jgi:hypothetical protein
VTTWPIFSVLKYSLEKGSLMAAFDRYTTAAQRLSIAKIHLIGLGLTAEPLLSARSQPSIPSRRLLLFWLEITCRREGREK